MLTTIRDAWELMPPVRRRRFVQVGLLSIIVSGLDMAAALAVALLLGLVLNPGDLPAVPVLGDLDDLFPAATYEQLVLWTCGAFALLFVGRAIFSVFQQYASSKVSENTALLLSDRLVDGYLSMPYEWHIQRNSAELVRNAWDNVAQVKTGAFKPMATLVAEAVLSVGMLVVLLTASVSLTIAAALVLGLAMFVTLLVVQPRLKKLGRIRQDAARTAMQGLQQAFGGVRDLKILAREASFSRRYFVARETMASSGYRKAVWSQMPRTAIELSFLGLLLVGIVVAVLRGEVTSILATLGVFAYAGLRLQPSLQKASQSMNSLRYVEAAVDDLREGLEVIDAARRARVSSDESQDVLTLEHDLKFEGVSYHYPNSNELALRDIDLVLPAGSSLGVVGVTGGGKSTLLDLICGLLTPSSGRITVDGRDLTEHTRAWQRGLGVVHQTSFLIDDTLRRNVALGVAEDHIDEPRVTKCLSMAQLDDVLAELPDGLETVLGEHGIRFSGGQRQRVTIARALYRNPSILILDEGTASLDNETERQLMEVVADVADMTLVMVAHRLSTVMHCDQILMVEHGSIVAKGTYSELMAKSEEFRVLAGQKTG